MTLRSLMGQIPALSTRKGSSGLGLSSCPMPEFYPDPSSSQPCLPPQAREETAGQQRTELSCSPRAQPTYGSQAARQKTTDRAQAGVATGARAGLSWEASVLLRPQGHTSPLASHVCDHSIVEFGSQVM